VSIERDGWKGSADLHGNWQVVIICDGDLVVKQEVDGSKSAKDIEDAIRRFIIEHTHCWQEEHKRYLDDCGSVGCRLTGSTWDEWNHEDNCEYCPFVIWYEDEWAQLFEEAEE
jgi:hypothetical protein